MDSGITTTAGNVGRVSIEVAGLNLEFHPVELDGLEKRGEQLAAEVGVQPADLAVVLRFLASGELEEIRPGELIRLVGGERFVIVESDRTYRFTLDKVVFDWPGRVVSGALLRRLGQIPADRDIFLEYPGRHDRRLDASDLVDLAARGIEHFVTRQRIWKLNVQGVIIEIDAPTIEVRRAIELAGLNPDQGWQIFLKVLGRPKEAVGLSDIIDLRKPGIEKLRLTPKHIDNGDNSSRRRDFGLLPEDEAHLNRLALHWETVLEADRRWLLIHRYPIPGGYTVADTLLALEIPPAYPGAQIYGFYACPPLALITPRAIPNTQMRGTVLGREFHGWSRNRGAVRWDPALDNVSTQLALVEAALLREVGE